MGRLQVLVQASLGFALTMRQELSARPRFLFSAVKVIAYQMLDGNAIGEKQRGKIAAQRVSGIKLKDRPRLEIAGTEQKYCCKPQKESHFRQRTYSRDDLERGCAFISILQQVQHRLTERGMARVVATIPTPACLIHGLGRLVGHGIACQRPLPPAPLASNFAGRSAKLLHKLQANMRDTHGSSTSH